MFGSLFRRNPKRDEPRQFVVAKLNARLMPLDRGEIFEDPLDLTLADMGVGNVTGGGTQLAANKEIDYCDIEIELKDLSDTTIAAIISRFEELGAPKGSELITSNSPSLPFGHYEGMALYLNGTDLPESIYKECDSNFVYSELNRLAGDTGRIFSQWAGPTETALYLYGPSFLEMQAAISEFVATYPLCERSRLIQIA